MITEAISCLLCSSRLATYQHHSRLDADKQELRPAKNPSATRCFGLLDGALVEFACESSTTASKKGSRGLRHLPACSSNRSHCPITDHQPTGFVHPSPPSHSHCNAHTPTKIFKIFWRLPLPPFFLLPSQQIVNRNIQASFSSARVSRAPSYPSQLPLHCSRVGNSLPSVNVDTSHESTSSSSRITNPTQHHPDRTSFFVFVLPTRTSKIKMSAPVEKTSDATVNDVTTLANTSKAADDKTNDAVLASAAEGRRLYIGNLAYATTEGELKDFFKGYLVYVMSFLLTLRFSLRVTVQFAALPEVFCNDSHPQHVFTCPRRRMPANHEQ